MPKTPLFANYGPAGTNAPLSSRHAEYFIDFVKSDQMTQEEKTIIIAEETNDILIAGSWLLTQEKMDYEFVKRLKPKKQL